MREWFGRSARRHRSSLSKVFAFSGILSRSTAGTGQEKTPASAGVLPFVIFKATARRGSFAGESRQKPTRPSPTGRASMAPEPRLLLWCRRLKLWSTH
jgi:hypothetical protein